MIRIHHNGQLVKINFKNLLKDYFISLGGDVHQPIRDELRNTVFQFWPQWFCIFLITLVWIFITFIPKLSNCPRGYIGPGGKHQHGLYQNCTGGKVYIYLIENNKIDHYRYCWIY